MNMLILYATKHGAAHETAQRIASRINSATCHATLHDLKQSGIPSLAGFDCVIIGSSVYTGTIHKEAKAFLSHNADALLGKRLGLFLCGMEAGGEQEYFKSNFSPDILQAARAAVFMGGIFDPAKTGAIGRFIMKAVTKQSGYTDTIDDVKIAQFAQAMIA